MKNVITKTVLFLASVACVATHASERTTYCNPLDIPYRYAIIEGDSSALSYREAADPTIVTFKGEYYLFASKCGVYYHSTDLVNWDAIHTNDLPMEGYAPTVVEMDGTLYFTHSVGTTHIWRTTDPKSGRWELIEGAGTPKNENDPMLMADNGRMYLFYGSSGNVDDGILGVELDATTLRPKGTPIRLLTANTARFGWEVPGDYNDDYRRDPWEEGVWLTKHNNKYYLQYATPATEVKSYCDAVYVSDNPLGPYKVQRHNPFCYRPEGFIASAGHGSTFQDKYGNWWHISTGTISRRHMFERRLVLYPAFFDADGLLYSYTGYGDYPLRVPQGKADSPADYRSGWMLLSYGKPVTASSCLPGHPAELAVNEDIRTWWSASTGDKGEGITVDLESNCDIHALQVNFADEGSTLRNDYSSVYKYKVEVSLDKKKWETVVNRSRQQRNAPHEYVELPKAVAARYVRLTNVYCPSGTFSVSGLRVFGKSAKALPDSPRFLKVERDADDTRQVHLSWAAIGNATGYNIHYGISPDKLYLDYIVYGKTDLTIRSLDAESDYYFTIEAFNEAGVSTRSSCEVAKIDHSTFTNPVIYADVPDVDVIRVGDVFYMVSTSMHFSPGCTIMKSTDLVNWQVVGYAHDQLEEADRFALKNGQSDYACGSWAANLRYDRHEGRYYLIVTCNTTQKSYIFTTTDIEKGHWHRNVVDMCYDPGLLFEDTGKECKKYVVHPDADLGVYTGYIREIHSDGKGGVKLGKKSVLFDYAQMEKPAEGLRAEGYHGYKIGDYYYVFMIQGQGAQRQETVWRSKTLKKGTFESRKIFAGNIVNADGTSYIPFTGVAQGGIVDTPDGHWYSMLFQDYGAVGRMPVLIPTEWQDGWPILGNQGKSVDRRLLKPIQGGKSLFPVVSDDFDNQQLRYVISDEESDSPEYKYNGSNLKLEWQWNHNPDNRYWSLTQRRGFLRLTTGSLASSIRDARNTLTQRTFGPTSMAETAIETRGMNDGDCAGLSSFQNQYGFVGVKKEGGKHYIVMRRARQKDDALGEEKECVPIDQDRVFLRVECDFRQMADKSYFYYSLDGLHWQRIGDVLQMRFDWPDFVGQRFALFNYATETIGGYVDFDYFHVSKDIKIK